MCVGVVGVVVVLRRVHEDVRAPSAWERGWSPREETSIVLAQRSRTTRTGVRTSTRTVGENQETGFSEPCARRSVTPREEARSPAKTQCSSSDLLSDIAADDRRRSDEVYQERSAASNEKQGFGCRSTRKRPSTLPHARRMRLRLHTCWLFCCSAHRRRARARRDRHVRRRGGGRVAQARSARRRSRSSTSRRVAGLGTIRHDVELVARRDRAARRRVETRAERVDRGAVRRRAPDRLDLSARPAHDAAQLARARRVRAVRSVDRAARARRSSDFIVGNEPNLNLFWMPQFGAGGVDLAAPSYELLLARTYDALKAVSPDINVIGGALSPRGQDKAELAAGRHTHRPRSSTTSASRIARPKPHASDHGHVRDPSVPDPVEAAADFAHPNTTTIGVADYPKLVTLLTTAFAGTAQPGATLPIVYDEFGYQSRDPDAEALALHAPRHAGRAGCDHRAAPGALLPAGDRDRALPADGRRDADLPRHRRARRERVAVGRLLPRRHAEDEHGRAPRGALAAQDGTLAQCAKAKTASNFESVVFHQPPAEPGPLQIDLTCASACAYTRAADRPARRHGRSQASTATATGLQTIAIPGDDHPTGEYQYTVRTFVTGKPGTAVVRSSRPFTITAPLPAAAGRRGPAAEDPPADPPPPPPAAAGGAAAACCRSCRRLPTLAPVVP